MKKGKKAKKIGRTEMKCRNTEEEKKRDDWSIYIKKDEIRESNKKRIHDVRDEKKRKIQIVTKYAAQNELNMTEMKENNTDSRK